MFEIHKVDKVQYTLLESNNLYFISTSLAIRKKKNHRLSINLNCWRQIYRCQIVNIKYKNIRAWRQVRSPIIGLIWRSSRCFANSCWIYVFLSNTYLYFTCIRYNCIYKLVLILYSRNLNSVLIKLSYLYFFFFFNNNFYFF